MYDSRQLPAPFSSVLMLSQYPQNATSIAVFLSCAFTKVQSIKHLEYCSNILQGEMSVANGRETIFKQKKFLAADKEFISECAHEAEKKQDEEKSNSNR